MSITTKISAINRSRLMLASGTPSLGPRIARDDNNSLKQLNYARKSSRDLLKKVCVQEAQPKHMKLFLTDTHTTPRKTQTQTQRATRSAKSPDANASQIRPSPSRPTLVFSNRWSQHKNKSEASVKKQYSLKINSKDREANNTPELDPQLVDNMINRFVTECGQRQLKLLESMGRSDYEVVTDRFGGDKCRPMFQEIWEASFKQRQQNWLSLLSFLLALFNKDLNSVGFFHQKPSFMTKDVQQSGSPGKKRVTIKRTLSSSGPPENNPASQRLGYYSNQNSCIDYTHAEKQQLILRFEGVRQIILDSLQKGPITNMKRSPTATEADPEADIILKVHLNNSLASMKICRNQSAAQIARKFASRQRLDKELQRKLCFLLSKELQNA